MLKLEHQFSPFGFCQVKRNGGKNVNSLLFSVYKSGVTGGTLVGHPGTDPLCILHIAAEPTRQPTTKRRKRKNSTSSTSNSSAGNAANSTSSKKKTTAANLSLSSQVPVSLAFLLGGNSCLYRLPIPGGPSEKTLSCKDLLGPAGREVGWGKGKAGTGIGGKGEDSVLKTSPCKLGTRKQYTESVLQRDRNENAIRVADRRYVT